MRVEGRHDLMLSCENPREYLQDLLEEDGLDVHLSSQIERSCRTIGQHQGELPHQVVGSTGM